MNPLFNPVIRGLALAGLLPLAAPALAAHGLSSSGVNVSIPARANAPEHGRQQGALILARRPAGRQPETITIAIPEWDRQRASPNVIPDLIVKDLRLNSRCELLITIANTGRGGVPERAYHRTRGAAVQVYRGQMTWGEVRLFAVDPGKRLKKPGTQVTYKWSHGAANLKLGPDFHLMRAVVDSNNVIRESNENNNSRTERLGCKGKRLRRH